jgi:hypothetical protein
MAEARVYFIKPVGQDGPIKIGCSRWPDRRLSEVMLWSPVELEIVASFGGGFKMERRFHAAFFNDHSHREWFRPSAALIETIASINAGTFDEKSLPKGRNLHWPGYRQGEAA